MSGGPRRILLVAGEASGDLYGSLLVRSLRAQGPAITFLGIGGSGMREAGVELLADSRDLAVVGLTEVISHWKPIRAAFHRAVRELRHAPPDLLLLIDYPDFNLRLARQAKLYGVPVVYFISPQVWAWRKSRLRTIAKNVAKMLVILPFEEDIYRKAGIPVQFVGHPLLDILPPPKERSQARYALGLDPDRRILGLLPGSRRRELEAHLPVMLESAQLLRKCIGDFQCLIPVASTLKPSDFHSILERFPGIPEPILVEGKPFDALSAMDVAVIKSGTATLEAALLGVPMVVVYRTSLITYALAWLLADVSHVGLVNIVAGERLVPERVQGSFTSEALTSLLESYFTEDLESIGDLRAKLLALRQRLGSPGCFQRAAESILQVLLGPAYVPGGVPAHD
jgi:lipid-A-disaccharide synthase